MSSFGEVMHLPVPLDCLSRPCQKGTPAEIFLISEQAMRDRQREQTTEAVAGPRRVRFNTCTICNDFLRYAWLISKHSDANSFERSRPRGQTLVLVSCNSQLSKMRSGRIVRMLLLSVIQSINTLKIKANQGHGSIILL